MQGDGEHSGDRGDGGDMVVEVMVGEAVVAVVMAMVEIMMMVVVRMVEVVMKFLNCS